jgi:hypothetical protein
MESVECPSCHRTFGDTTLLSLHHEYEPCFQSNFSSSSTKKNLTCPICDEIFDDHQVLQIHVNEVHDHTPVHTPSTATTTSDNLYAQELARRERMKIQYEQQTASAISYERLEENDDAHIARMLQEEENAQSFEEFQVN